MDRDVELLLVSGSLRRRSTSSAALRTASACAPAGVAAVLYEGLQALPHFNPDDDREPLPPSVATLRSMIRSADGVIVSTPEYAGTLPGALKTLLEWTVGDDRPGSMSGKPVGWLNVSPRGAGNAHDSLRTVLRYAGADIVEAACSAIPVAHATVGDDGLIGDDGIRRQIVASLRALAAHCRAGHRAMDAPESDGGLPTD